MGKPCALRASSSQGRVWSRRRRPQWYRSETENARCMTARMPKRRNTSAGSSSSMCQTWMLQWNGQRGIQLRLTHSLKCVHWAVRILPWAASNQVALATGPCNERSNQHETFDSSLDSHRLGIPIIGYVYSPFEELPNYAPVVRYVALPVIVLTGFWMWKGDALATTYFEKIELIGANSSPDTAITRKPL